MRIKLNGLRIGILLVLGGGFVWYFLAQFQGNPLPQTGPRGATKSAPSAGQTRAASVSVALVEQGAQPIEIAAIGSVQASETVGVKSRVDGIISGVHITDGQEVQEGDLLFTIESRTLEAQLRQAEANLQRDQTVFENAKRTLERQQTLALRNIASQSALDTAQTTAAAADQAIKATQAQVEALRINLGYTRITAPISGRVGEIKLTKGNLVKANDTNSLVTLRKLRPINLVFSISQRHFFDLRKAMENQKVGVTAQIPDQPNSTATGEIAFYDTTLDPTTGTFLVKALFANQNNHLWPGMFTPLTVHLGTEPDAISIPSSAVQIGQQGTYVYVIRFAQDAPAILLAEFRPITVARTLGSRSIVGKGLAPLEKVVTDGQLRLTDGARVELSFPSLDQ